MDYMPIGYEPLTRTSLPIFVCVLYPKDETVIPVMSNHTDTLDRIIDKRQRWENLLDEKREARLEAQGARREQIETQIAIIEQICDDLSDLLGRYFSDVDDESGIAIFDRHGFAWFSNRHNPVDALEEFDREVGIDARDKSLRRIAENHTFFEVPEKDLPRWQDASVDDHPDTAGLRRVSL